MNRGKRKIEAQEDPILTLKYQGSIFIGVPLPFLIWGLFSIDDNFARLATIFLYIIHSAVWVNMAFSIKRFSIKDAHLFVQIGKKNITDIPLESLKEIRLRGKNSIIITRKTIKKFNSGVPLNFNFVIDASEVVTKIHSAYPELKPQD